MQEHLSFVLVTSYSVLYTSLLRYKKIDLSQQTWLSMPL